MSGFTLTAEEIQTNYLTFRKIINVRFPTRKIQLNQMYDELNDEDERVAMAPASSYEFFHNAIPGGYVDHVLRVYRFAIEQYALWQKVGMKVDNFTLEELEFAALHHDLGKLGLPGLNNEYYQFNDSKWHRDNQGKMYASNPNVPWMKTADVTVYLLNHYHVPYSVNEMLGMKLTDGLFEEENKKYLAGFDKNTKLRTSLPYLLHHADIMAYRYEFERWAESSGDFKLSIDSKKIEPVKVIEPKTKFNVDELDEFLK